MTAQKNKALKSLSLPVGKKITKLSGITKITSRLGYLILQPDGLWIAYNNKGQWLHHNALPFAINHI